MLVVKKQAVSIFQIQSQQLAGLPTKIQAQKLSTKIQSTNLSAEPVPKQNVKNLEKVFEL